MQSLGNVPGRYRMIEICTRENAPCKRVEPVDVDGQNVTMSSRLVRPA